MSLKRLKQFLDREPVSIRTKADSASSFHLLCYYLALLSLVDHRTDSQSELCALAYNVYLSVLQRGQLGWN